MNIKKITALALAAVLAAAGFTGCSKNYDAVVTVEDTAFSPSMYLCAQYQAYNAAWEEVSEDTTDLFKATIDDMSAEEWIHAETIRNLQIFAWTEKTYSEMGLSLDEEEQGYIDYQVEYYWPYMEEYYSANGIGKDTYAKFTELNYKANEIFAEIYKDGSEKAPTEAECRAYMDENYTRVKGFYMPKYNADGTELDEKGKQAVLDLCDEAMAELSAGGSIYEICSKYKTKATLITGDKNDYSDGSVYVTETYVGRTSDTFPQIVCDNAFKMEENGSFICDETKNSYFIYQRVPNFADNSEFTTMKSSILSEMKGPEHNEYVETEAVKLEVKENTAAVKHYSVKNIK